jgi:hypothetical protein
MRKIKCAICGHEAEYDETNPEAFLPDWIPYFWKKNSRTGMDVCHDFACPGCVTASLMYDETLSEWVFKKEIEHVTIMSELE